MTTLNEQSERERSALSIIKHWISNSPSHGIRRINRASSLSGRIFWSVVFLIFTTLMCTFIVTAIKKYITHPTKINLSVRQYQDSLHYPAITFCNLNPLSNDKFLLGDPSNESDYRRRFTDYISAQLSADLLNNRSTSIGSGYRLEELLIQCVFNGASCSHDFSSFFHPNYGNCYTFNPDEHVIAVPRTGSSQFWSMDDGDRSYGYKLFLELYLFEDEYNPHLDDRAAFRVFIHRKHEVPILSQNSVFLAPTVFTKLLFSHRQIFLSRECRTAPTDQMKQTFRNYQGRYTQALCYKLCELHYIERECHCTDPLLMIFFQFFRDNQSAPMTVNRSCSSTRSCRSIRSNFNSKQFCPDCLPECELIQYTIQSSYADYPNNRAMSKVKQRVKKHLDGVRNISSRSNTTGACSNTKKDPLLESIVAVEISASPYATEILTESPMYTWVDLISSIGGQTGLWIGVSLISFVEVAELIFRLLCYYLLLIYQGCFKWGKRAYETAFPQQWTTHL